jgi:hypothetical protein
VLLRRKALGTPRPLDGFVESLVQSFENCRPGLPDEGLSPAQAEPFFRDLYEKEKPRLRDTIRAEEPHLSDEARAEYARAVDAHARKVLVPAYARLAARFTERERNGFYRLPEPLHAVERALLCLLGIGVGALVVWAPFIPVWEKWWVLPFALTGLFAPELRRAFALKRYESEVNSLVARSDHEIVRLDSAYLTSTEALAERDKKKLPGRDAGRVSN